MSTESTTLRKRSVVLFLWAPAPHLATVITVKHGRVRDDEDISATENQMNVMGQHGVRQHIDAHKYLDSG